MKESWHKYNLGGLINESRHTYERVETHISTYLSTCMTMADQCTNVDTSMKKSYTREKRKKKHLSALMTFTDHMNDDTYIKKSCK